MEVSEAMVAIDPGNLSIIGPSVEYEWSLLIGRKCLCWRTLAARRAYIEGGWEPRMPRRGKELFVSRWGGAHDAISSLYDIALKTDRTRELGLYCIQYRTEID